MFVVPIPYFCFELNAVDGVQRTYYRSTVFLVIALTEELNYSILYIDLSANSRRPTHWFDETGEGYHHATQLCCVTLCLLRLPWCVWSRVSQRTGYWGFQRYPVICGVTTTRFDGEKLLQRRPEGTFLLRLSSRPGALAVMYVKRHQEASRLIRSGDVNRYATCCIIRKLFNYSLLRDATNIIEPLCPGDLRAQGVLPMEASMVGG